MEKSQAYSPVPPSESETFSDDGLLPHHGPHRHHQSSWLGASTVRGALTILGMVSMLVLGFVLGVNVQHITGSPHRYGKPSSLFHY